MDYKFFEKTVKITNGIDLTVRIGKLACRADGAVEIRFGNNVILVTAVWNKNNVKEEDFLPLLVDYHEKFYANGRIPNGCKREGKLNEHEILISRLIDRCIRPCVDRNFNKETQINVSVLSADREYNPEIYACFGTSLAALISGIDFYEPVSEVFVYLIDNKWEINPRKEDIARSKCRLIVGGNEKSLIMCEGSASCIGDDKLIEGINVSLEEIKKHCEIQREILKEYNFIWKTRENICNDNYNNELVEKIYEIYRNGIKSKRERESLLEKIIEEYRKENENNNKNINKIIKNSKKMAMKKLFAEGSKRIDGRSVGEIREISCDVDYLPCAHGSALFIRGETEALVSVTLGDKKDEQPKEEAFEYGYNRIVLHYNFPGYCVNEISHSRNTGRREVGHGNLALNGLLAVIPENNLFTIRIVSDILSSNGSSSMATVCGSCLALKDAGIQLKETVAGIAMGLFYDKEKNNYIVLSDISSDEDEFGDMDFKIIGSESGITGIQLDVKFLGLNMNILTNTLKQAREGLNSIIKKMNNAIPNPRVEPKDFAPHCTTLECEKKMLGLVIGSNGHNIQNIQKETNSYISICGTKINIVSRNKFSLDECKNKILSIITIPNENDIYDGIVKKVQENFALVEFMPGKIGILKKEEVDSVSIDDLTSVLFVGDRITVRMIDNSEFGKYVLSHRVLLEKTEEINSSGNNYCDEKIPDNI